MTMWLNRIAWLTPKDTNTYSDYVILIAFLLQQWLHEHTAMSHYLFCLNSVILLSVHGKLLL
jgi:hypothetical protein